MSKLAAGLAALDGLASERLARLDAISVDIRATEEAMAKAIVPPFEMDDAEIKLAWTGKRIAYANASTGKQTHLLGASAVIRERVAELGLLERVVEAALNRMNGPRHGAQGAEP